MADWETGVQWWAWLLGIATTTVFLALVVWAVVALVCPARSGGNGPEGPEGLPGPGGLEGPPGAGGARDGGGAAQAQARRYAAGDTTAGEYRRGVGALGQ